MPISAIMPPATQRQKQKTDARVPYRPRLSAEERSCRVGAEAAGAARAARGDWDCIIGVRWPEDVVGCENERVGAGVKDGLGALRVGRDSIAGVRAAGDTARGEIERAGAGVKDGAGVLRSGVKDGVGMLRTGGGAGEGVMRGAAKAGVETLRDTLAGVGETGAATGA